MDSVTLDKTYSHEQSSKKGTCKDGCDYWPCAGWVRQVAKATHIAIAISRVRAWLDTLDSESAARIKDRLKKDGIQF